MHSGTALGRLVRISLTAPLALMSSILYNRRVAEE